MRLLLFLFIKIANILYLNVIFISLEMWTSFTAEGLAQMHSHSATNKLMICNF